MQWEPRVLANSASSVSRRRSPMPCFTLPANASGNCRSRWTKCCNESSKCGVRVRRRRPRVTTTAYIGQSINRTDGPAKVTGDAKYAYEHHFENLAYGFVVSSTVARGTIRRIDAAAALGLPGVLQVFTHENAPRISPSNGEIPDEAKSPGTPFIPLQDHDVRFSQQPVALVVAETLEIARYAASLVHVEYN